jgi:hypothetical protein
MTADSSPEKTRPASADASASPTRCPRCGTAVDGRFCSNCGTAVGAGRCAGCGTDLTPSARFCHRCGLPAGAQAPAGTSFTQSPVPWALGGIALLSLVALLAGQQFGNRIRAGDNAAPPAGAAPVGGARPPDLSTMTPEEQRQRLYDRVMTYAETGRRDSLAMFAPMAIMAFQQLGPLDTDGRYDLGRIGEVSGELDLARAQADTILAANPDHLLGLLLAARIARARSDAAAERSYADRFLAALPGERQKQLTEYTTHARDIAAAESEARRLLGR